MTAYTWYLPAGAGGFLLAFDNPPFAPMNNHDLNDIPNRDEKHGGLGQVGFTSQLLKEVIRQGQNYSRLRPSEAEALDMIGHKIARILNGADPHNREHWEDVAGYALAAMRANQ